MSFAAGARIPSCASFRPSSHNDHADAGIRLYELALSRTCRANLWFASGRGSRIEFRIMNLISTFAASVERRPEKTALFWGDHSFSYQDLWDETLSISGRLRHQYGLKRGDRAGLWLKNCPEFIPSLFAILHAGAVAVPINNFLKPDEVSYILNDAGIDVLITDGD